MIDTLDIALDTILVHHTDTVTLTELVVVQEKNDLFFGLVSSDTLFTALITLIIFFLGYVVSTLFSWAKRKGEVHHEKQIFQYHLKKTFEEFLPKIINAYDRTTENLNVINGMALTPPKVFSADFQRLIRMDNPRLFRLFHHHKDLSKVLSLSNFIEELMVHSNDYYLRMRENNDKLRLRLKVQLEGDEHNAGFTTALTNFLIREEKENPVYKYDPSYKLVSEKLVQYHTVYKEEKGIDDIYVDIIRSIQEWFGKKGTYKKDPLVMTIVERGRLVSYTYNQLVDETDQIKRELEKLRAMFQDTKDQYDEANLSFLKSTKLEKRFGSLIK